MHPRPSSRLVLRIGGWSLGLLGLILAHRLWTPTDLPVDPPIPFDEVARAGDPITLHAPPVPIAAPVSPTPAALAPQTLTGKAAEDALKQSGQYASLGAALQAARYAAEKIDPAGPHSRGAEYFAANPKQQLRAWFGKEGIELASGQRTEEGKAPWRLKLRLASVERVVDGVAPGGLSAVEGPRAMPNPPSAASTSSHDAAKGEKTAPAAGSPGIARGATPSTITAEHHRVEIAHTDGVTEWYENRTEGIEQGFTLAQRPAGAGAEVAVELEAEGTLHVQQPQEDAVRFTDETDAEIVEYGGLKAWDATGRTLPARMEVRGQELALLVNDAGALYPITIDPLFANVEARLAETTSEGEWFGRSVSISGDTALIGADGSNGADGFAAGCAYVFVRSGTVWTQQAKLTAADRATSVAFGISVALDRDTALIGDYLANTPPGFSTGSAYVFVRTGTKWAEQSRFTVPDAGSDLFGFATAISGDTALVGVFNNYTPEAPSAGSAFVFVRTGTTWQRQAKLTASDGAAFDSFGTAVALDGETALVGAFGKDIPTEINSGSVYVFTRIGSVWTEREKLTPTDGRTGDLFGSAVALDGDVAIGSAPGCNTTAGADSGAAYIFSRSGPTWVEHAKLTASDAATGDSFGSAVALSGGTALVGARGDDKPAGADSGSAYVFVRTGSTWTQQAKLIASFGTAGDQFGMSVALSGETALVGTSEDDILGVPDAGTTSVFVRSGTAWSKQGPTLASRDGSSFDGLGVSVAVHGDTALIGAPDDGLGNGFPTGSAFIFKRSSAGWFEQAKLKASDDQTNTSFGYAVALGDGIALVGAPRATSNGGYPTGAAYVFVRDGTAWTLEATLSGNDAMQEDRFGHAVALSGETALATAPLHDTSAGSDAGTTYIFVRNGTNWSQQAMLEPVINFSEREH